MLEGRKVPAPIFTLRGHNSGVTALVEWSIHNNDNNKTYLISGDEDGTIIIWDLDIYRKVLSFQNSFESRIQSLKVVSLVIENVKNNILIVQTRDQGIFIVDITFNITHSQDVKLKQIASYPTYPSIFSRGDAIDDNDENSAILAYPSCLENYFVTVRILNNDAETKLSGTAQRNNESEKNFTVFDIKLKTVIEQNTKKHLLAVAYEDGHLCIFKFSSQSTQTVPHLQSTGLKIELIKNYDLKIGDFISAFDLLIKSDFNKFTIISGTPMTELICINDSLKSSDSFDMFQIALKQQGISSLTIRPDGKLFVTGCWDNMIRLYSMKSKKLLATLSHHSKQVHDIIFIERDSNIEEASKSNDIIGNKTKKFFLYCASMEGTISIVSIY